MKYQRIIGPILLALLLLCGCGGKEGSPQQEIPLEQILASIEAAYGEDFLATGEVLPELIEAEFGLTEEMYREVLARMPMIGAHPDRVVLVRALPGQADNVEAALDEARRQKIADETQYPMNIAKTSAAQVVRNGEYVALLLVGAPPDPGLDESQAAAHAREEVQKGVDAFREAFQ